MVEGRGGREGSGGGGAVTVQAAFLWFMWAGEGSVDLRGNRMEIRVSEIEC